MKQRLDVLLINPSDVAVYQDAVSDLKAIEPPVWAGLMATFLRRKGIAVDILDANALNWSVFRVAEEVKIVNPRLAAIICYGHNPSASTQVMPGALACASAIKKFCGNDVKVIMVGGHVAALPERTLQEEAVDFVARGEGLYTVLDLALTLRNGGGGLGAARGLLGNYWNDRGDRTFYDNVPALLLQDLDKGMPAVAWDLLPMERYRAHNWHCDFSKPRQPYAAIYTSLSCPYNCSFCCISSPFRDAPGAKANGYREWSPVIAVDQIEYLVKEKGICNLKIADEMFVMNRRHVEGICDEIKRRGLGDFLNIWAYARVDTLRDGMAEKLRAAGFRWLAFGIESAVESVRDGVDKDYKQEHIFRAREKCRECDINFGANYMLGLPDDTPETMQQTLDLALELRTEYANFYPVYAFPGSPLYAQVLKEHPDWLPDLWSGYGFFSEDAKPLPTKYLTAAEVLRFRDEAWLRYFTDEGYLVHARCRFGDGCVEEIRRMTARPLRRRLLEEAHAI